MCQGMIIGLIDLLSKGLFATHVWDLFPAAWGRSSTPEALIGRSTTTCRSKDGQAGNVGHPESNCFREITAASICIPTIVRDGLIPAKSGAVLGWLSQASSSKLVACFSLDANPKDHLWSTIIESDRGARDLVLDLSAACVNLNHERRAMQADQKGVPSDGFMVNVPDFNQLCEPFVIAQVLDSGLMNGTAPQRLAELIDFLGHRRHNSKKSRER